ncbi:nitrogen fixation protein NifM [Uliginosibacterium aquaticum]|uniref:peptidylprolyl isomerase n=1 Tax=Uliginosibacterium aquaticum TaxID=2731212 RepID=A0ABX2IEK8_9RHOO|nr:nitrogen fixation protein NifM [Uliginosibacterium aquaticum]NSL55111.1 nitrogen fixation protein NifM [Uliginosibacterium aquaticum]
MSEIASPSPVVTATPASATPASSAASGYLALKQAQALFKTTPERLDAEQHHKLEAVVNRQRAIETRILGSRQATHVVISPEAVTHSIAEIAANFSNEAEFVCDLARFGLSEQSLRAEVERELRVEAVLEMVSAKVAPVSNMEVELFYHLHHARFETPERRTLRHILLTHDDSEAGRATSRQRIEVIRELLLRHPDRFGEQALRHSECPTAMQGGLLGQVPRGQLFPALDAAAFTMRAGSLSEALESPMGFHLLRCENIQPAGKVPLTQVRDRIREQMLITRKQNKQRAWVCQIMSHEART